jgi:hypothetical protein
MANTLSLPFLFGSSYDPFYRVAFDLIWVVAVATIYVLLVLATAFAVRRKTAGVRWVLSWPVIVIACGYPAWLFIQPSIEAITSFFSRP